VDLTKQKPKNMLVYIHWACLMYPNLVKEKQKNDYDFYRTQLNPLERSKFIDLIHALEKAA
jgi:hypothetical protein